MGNSKWLAIGSAITLCILIGILIVGTRPRNELGEEPLTLFCAAGISAPVQQIIDDYESEFGVKVNPVYDGSGKLLSTIRSYGGGDLYLAADQSYFVEADSYGLIAETASIARQRPCLCVRKKDAEKWDLKTIDDLLASEASWSLADPQVAAISRVARARLEAHDGTDTQTWQALWEKRVVTRDTVNQVAADVQTKVVDVGLVWDATAAQRDDLAIIRIDAFDRLPNEIAIAVLNDSKQPSRALHFMRYLTARDQGLVKFEQQGYETIEGDKWASRPTLTLFTGGLMHPSLQQSIEEFEAREQVDVVQNPNGCGVLVSEINAGEIPDVYFACDKTFMEKVADKFHDVRDVSRTEMVIVINKSKQRRFNVESLADLTKSDMRIGLCSPDHSALGDLSMKLLKRHRLWDTIQPRVLDWPSTADRLVEQVAVDALDAAIVYRANTTLRTDDLVVIDIDEADAIAIQPIAIANASDYPHLANRLIAKIRSDESKDRFESRGFVWLVDPDTP